MSLHSLAPWRRHVVPLVWCDDATLDDGEGVHDVGTQSRVDILRYKLGWRHAVLGPVRVVTHTYIFRGSCKAIHLDFNAGDQYIIRTRSMGY